MSENIDAPRVVHSFYSLKKSLTHRWHPDTTTNRLNDFFLRKKRIPNSSELLDWVIVPPFCILDAGGQAWDLHSRVQTTKKERIADSEKSLRILKGRTVCPYTQYIRSASNIAQVVFNTNQHLIWVIAKYYMYIIGSLIIVVTGYL